MAINCYKKNLSNTHEKCLDRKDNPERNDIIIVPEEFNKVYRHLSIIPQL
jgi:hypothetical protein